MRPGGGAPMSNFFLPVAAQQGQQGQRLAGTGRRGAAAAGSVQQPLPMMQQQVFI